MGCSVYQEKLSDYIDNLLPDVEVRRVEQHLSGCSRCRLIYEDLVMICQASRNLPEYEPSEVVWERILAQVSPGGASLSASAGARTTARWFPLKILSSGVSLWQPALIAALLIMGMSAIIMYYRSSLPQPESLMGKHVNWTDGQPRINVHPTNNLIVHKPLIEVEIVQRRIDELQRHIQTLQPRWSPGVRAFYRRNLRLIDDCLIRCRGEATMSGHDPAVQDVYQAALRAKLELLKQFSHM